MCAQGKAGAQFFNRTHELACLKSLAASEPRRAGITVLVGPPSSGKTALVQHFVSQLMKQQLEQRQQLPGSLVLPLYIDCSVNIVSTPDSFAAALINSFLSLGKEVFPSEADTIMDILSDHFNPPGQVKLGPAHAIVQGFRAHLSGTPLAHTLDVFMGAFDSCRESGSPFIIIDEANRLKSWSTEHPSELETLLGFLVAVTKQENLANVLLLTSDCAYVDWLEKGERSVCCCHQALLPGDMRLAFILTPCGARLVRRGGHKL